ncbi:MAG TPA: peptidase [candidate division WOR-3 bacterium]|uniref:Tricorn protease homolog n=1 Tax=candidate division WOR-3 bacterium TaxID=2052148 RepID=A0A9C9EMB3_UNCW3|nr:peptidase [candidate division WOR-3 bacterium]
MQGYYRFPTINKDKLIFVCEDDLWTVSIKGGIARRLTSNLGEVSHPFISPDGKYVAFIGREEGNPEVYCMEANGGTAVRLTFTGAQCTVVGWTKDSKRILFASNTKQWYPRTMYIYSVSREKDFPKLISVGPATQISYGPEKGVVIGRHTADPARWKRYRGGTAGVLWIDKNGTGNFKKLIELKGNFAAPMWIGKRIYFICDHEGIGNIYSCTPEGKQLQRHTNHTTFYVRNATTDGKNIVYHAGGDIYIYYTDLKTSKKVEIEYHGPRIQTNRKFVDASKYLEDYSIHPQGKSVSVTSRGKVFSMPTWEGPVTQNGGDIKARYRLGKWLHDEKRFIVVTDEKGEDVLQIHYPEANKKPETLPLLDIGRPIELEPSPQKPVVALTNHRNELILVDLQSRKRVIIDQSKYSRIQDIAWAPDGNWLAYSFPDSEHTSCIKVCHIKSKKTYPVTRTVLHDFSPSFDPEGRYLYFLSNRHFDPVYDTMQFELSFPANIKPYIVILKKETPAPFTYTQIAPVGLDMPMPDKASMKKKKGTPKIEIELKGIKDRIIPLPLPAGNYGQIWGIKNKVLFSTYPIEGGIKQWISEEPSNNGTLKFYDFIEQKSGVITTGISDFKVSRNGEILIYRAKNQLRVIKPVEKVDEKLPKKPVGPKSGWLDLARIKVLVEPINEWRQMYRDVWRLQRDHFWVKDMSGVDWNKIYKRYLPLLERISTRSEFSDLIWEMQGELGTSHAYEWGGDYRQPPAYRQGFLGADFIYDKKRDAYRIINIVKGDPWEKGKTSPLCAPGLDIKEGDLLIAIQGKRVNKKTLPEELLVNRADTEILLTIAKQNRKGQKTFTVKPLSDETGARYRDWVEMNREKVHRLSGNRIGYVHIPDMGPFGFAEFHRYFLSEIQYPGLIVDVRFNRGGHVSELLLEKLARKRIAYDVNRWGQPHPYPYESVLGPIVCITNEYAGSDGDIFSHAFKLYKIGPLIGKRTWGGVIGISPYYNLSDGGLTTQPEYSFWFFDVGWGVENYGTDPDIEVEIKPQDHVKGRDPQLARGIQECLKLMRKRPPRKPKFGKRPKLKLPERLG